jgi:hypothetical protein
LFIIVIGYVERRGLNVGSERKEKVRENEEVKRDLYE